MNENRLQAIAEAIESATGCYPDTSRYHAVSGGDINRCYVLGSGQNQFFVKLNTATHAGMMAAELSSLQVLAAAAAIKVPAPVASGTCGETSYLVLEYLPLQNRGDASALGRQLARLHRNLSPDRQFGWRSDNFIGTTPQLNSWCDNWPAFWRENRLGPQLDLAYKNGYRQILQPLAEELEQKLDRFWEGITVLPSLLHGDLWAGNAAYLASGEPVIFDPACYYGSREADIALTELFGGYPADFYAAYEAEWPLDEGYERRRNLYNLYHLLNHLNLFGAGYADSCRRCLQQLLAQPL